MGLLVFDGKDGQGSRGNFKVNALIITGNEQDYRSVEQLFKQKARWIYRHEQLKHCHGDLVILLPSTKKMHDYETVMTTILNKGFPIIDFMGVT